ncbi:uncharacterized protein LOC141680280 [Apium graveolens]|uniref:uncharacterized protein LOC141680280 n=1 Tax=Apium graveolens TaxID=4045 RepID=UPI003D7A2182
MFVSKLAEKSIPFFDALKGVNKSKEVQWTPSYQEAFDFLKNYLSSPPIISQPLSGEPLCLHLVVAHGAVSSYLIHEAGDKQLLVYYVSIVLRDAEMRYPAIEKMLEVHEGICRSHSFGEALAHKIIKKGYYWPTLRKNCLNYVKTCAKYQFHALVPKLPPTFPTTILSPIPFDTWGVDIMGPFSPTKGNIRFLLVVVDYMTKWVEAKAVAHTTSTVCQKKFHEHILTRFRIPCVLITDNGRQFIEAEFEEYLTAYGIQHRRLSMAYPQSNGQVKITN